MIFRFSLTVALWLAWKRTASLPLCLAFWITVLIWCVRPIASRRPSAVWVLVLIGVLSNAVVTLANFGVMPANYDVATFIPSSPIWQPAVDHHLLLLSDQRVLSYFSIGDLCLLTGSVLAFILRRRHRQARVVHLLPRLMPNLAFGLRKQCSCSYASALSFASSCWLFWREDLREPTCGEGHAELAILGEEMEATQWVTRALLGHEELPVEASIV
jgi:hypothetical protein